MTANSKEAVSLPDTTPFVALTPTEGPVGLPVEPLTLEESPLGAAVAAGISVDGFDGTERRAVVPGTLTRTVA
jgi:hypothetical protein